MSKRLVINYRMTESDASVGYSSFIDGYHPGAVQSVLTFWVRAPDDFTAEMVAEEIFEATNSPYTLHPSSVAYQARQALTRLARDGQPVRSLSVGDTVTVRTAGQDDGEALVCKSMGWQSLTEYLAQGEFTTLAQDA